jgi:predicted PurR-regulated permease PerM
MNPTRPLLFWLVSLALLLAVAVVLREVLLPFVAGLALAYLLDPLVGRLERLGLNRAVATLFMLAVFFFGVIGVLVLTIPMIASEVALLVDKLPSYVKRLRALATDPSSPSMGKVIELGLSEAERSSGELVSLGAGWLAGFLRSLWSDGRMLISVFSLLVVTPIVAAYLVYDWNRIIAALDDLVPAAHRGTVRMLAREIDGTIAAFLRGQATICLLLGLFYAVALRALELNHGILIGLVAGLLGFVPYFGSLTGLLLSVSVALAQFGLSWTPALYVLAIFMVGQSVADYVLAPYLVGNKVHVNAVWLLFALFSCGYLFGFVGLLIAVPLAASIGVLVRFALRHSLAHSSASPAPAQFRAEVDLSQKLPRPPLP